MKLTSLFSVALAATSAFASATSLTRNYDVVRARQAKVQRDLLDICAGLDVDLEVDLLSKSTEKESIYWLQYTNDIPSASSSKDCRWTYRYLSLHFLNSHIHSGQRRGASRCSPGRRGQGHRSY